MLKSSDFNSFLDIGLRWYDGGVIGNDGEIGRVYFMHLARVMNALVNNQAIGFSQLVIAECKHH